MSLKLIGLTPACYDALEKLKQETKAAKQKRGEPTRTSFSEIVCMLLRERKGDTLC